MNIKDTTVLVLALVACFMCAALLSARVEGIVFIVGLMLLQFVVVLAIVFAVTTAFRFLVAKRHFPAMVETHPLLSRIPEFAIYVFLFWLAFSRSTLFCETVAGFAIVVFFLGRFNRTRMSPG